MRPGADKVKVRQHIVAIVHAEPGALRQQRFQAEGAAQMRVEIVPEIGGV
jgi:hypothetical protein